MRADGKGSLTGEEGVDIEDDGLDVVGRTYQLPNPLVDRRLVVQSSHYQGPVNGPPTPSRILQNPLSLL